MDEQLCRSEKKGRSRGLSFLCEHAFLATMVVALLLSCVYLPGLHGPFLFDDFANLPNLGNEGAISSIPRLLRYLTSGTADPTGRPLALLSFLIDAQNWPADPLPFKRTNLMLHLLNGVLLAIFFRRLGRAITPETSPEHAQRQDFSAALAAAIWLLHPLFVSTTMYVVQREAMLPGTTIMCGLLAWLSGRRCYERDQWLCGHAWMMCFVGMTVLGVLSKANGILLPVLMIALEYTALSMVGLARTKQPYRRAFLLVGWLPTVAIASFLIYQGWYHSTHEMTVRPWTIGQRVLTEPRVIWTYLRLIWLPTPYTAGVFNDQVIASRSILAPWTTLAAIAATFCLVAVAWRMRKVRPALSAALAFYLAGLSLESTTIPLELYYEHRNYVPAMLMFWPMARWLAMLPTSTTATLQPSHNVVQVRLRLIATVLILFFLAGMTWANAELWGNAPAQAQLWAKINPGSMRAQTNAAQDDLERGHPDEALQRLAPLLATHPLEVQLAFNLLAAQCELGGIRDDTFAQAKSALAGTRDPGALITSWFSRAVTLASDGTCNGMTLSRVDELATAGLTNRLLSPGRRQDLLHVRGQVALIQGDALLALGYFDRALLLDVRVGFALQQAALLGSADHPSEGLAHLAYFRAHQAQVSRPGAGMPRIHEWLLNRQGYWTSEMLRLQRTLEEDVQVKRKPGAQS